MGDDAANSPYDLAESALAWIDEFYARMFRDWPGAVTRHNDGYTLSYSGDVHLSGANHIWPHHLSSLTPQSIQEAAAFFAAFEAIWSVICVQPFMDSTLRSLFEQSFTLRWDATLMVLDAANNARPHLPDPAPTEAQLRHDVRLIRAMSITHLHDLMTILSESFATGPNVNRRVVRRDHLDDPTVRHYMLYKGLHPVSAATVMLHSDHPQPNGSQPAMRRMASIWNVGTRPRFRRRGYASVLMAGLLADLRGQGIMTVTLLSSASGYGLYRQLGFREIGTVAYLGPPHNRH